MAINTVGDQAAEQQFPLMKLPKEIRLMVYDSAIEDVVNTISALQLDEVTVRRMNKSPQSAGPFMSNTNTRSYSVTKKRSKKERSARKRTASVEKSYKGPPFIGALALLHVDSTVRSESAAVMLSRISFHRVAIKALLEPYLYLEIEESDSDDLYVYPGIEESDFDHVLACDDDHYLREQEAQDRIFDDMEKDYDSCVAHYREFLTAMNHRWKLGKIKQILTVAVRSKTACSKAARSRG